MNLTKFILILLVSNLLKAKCEQGCLICNKEDKLCKACDIVQGYYLKSDNSCEKTKIENCLLIDTFNQCSICNTGFYSDKSVNSCVKVSESIKNCQYYDGATSCSTCLEGYYVQGGNCLLPETKIDGCVNYLSTTACLVCSSGKALSQDKKLCQSASSANCQAFSPIMCVKCSTDYPIFHNNYLKAIKSNLSTKPNLLENYLSALAEKNGILTTYGYHVCATIDTPNCLLPKDYNKCLQCAGGYFLNDALRCQVYPTSPILNCSIYESNSKCTKCSKGFHLQSGTVCKLNDSIADCKEYSQLSQSTQCLRCEDSHLVNTNHACSLRSKTFEFCAVYSSSAETCQTCEEGRKPTDDGLKCLPTISNCNTYISSNLSFDQLFCLECKKGSFRVESGTKCQTGTIANCDIYQLNENVCLSCFNKFYLSEGKCVQHGEVKGCIDYDQREKDKCVKCNATSYLFQVSMICEGVNGLTGCSTYPTKTTCNACIDGYILRGAACELIPTILNCLTADQDDACTKCKPGYYLKSGKCVDHLKSLKQNCNELNDDGTVDIKSIECKNCNQYSYWRSFTRKTCLHQDDFTLLSANTSANCRSYNLNIANGEVTCDKVTVGYFKQTSTNIQPCQSDDIYFKGELVSGGSGLYFLVDPFTYCDPSANSTSCLMQARKTNAFGLSCVQCRANHLPTISLSNADTVAMHTHNKDNSLLADSPVSRYPEISCQANTGLTHLAGGLVDNCQYYMKSSSSIACVKCVNGLVGALKNNANGNHQQNCETSIANCNQNNFVQGADLEINMLLACHECSAGIPFLFVTYANAGITGIKQYNPATFIESNTSSAYQGFTTQCLTLTTELFPIAAPTLITNLPSNCAVVLWNISHSTHNFDDIRKTADADLTKMTAFCVACKPGYKRIGGKRAGNVAIKHYASQCDQISNCQTSTWMNFCSQCIANYSFKYVTGEGVKYDECVLSNDTHCLAYEASSCKYCVKGYFMNESGKCELLKVPSCAAGHAYDIKSYHTIDLATLYWNQPGYDCDECVAEHVLYVSTWKPKVCVERARLLDTDVSGGFIAHCKHYTTAEVFKCAYCEANFIIDTTGKHCFAQDQILNCKVATSQTECQTCLDNYLLLSSQCVVPAIDNCKTHKIVEGNQKCSQCKDTYYKNSLETQCLKGAVERCKVYSNQEKVCVECEAGYQHIQILASKSYCIQKENSYKCTLFKSASFLVGTLDCQTCDPLHMRIARKQTMGPTYCGPINLIANCLEYDVKATLSSSSLLCVKCSPDYHFNTDGQCVARKIKDANCSTYSLDKDLCSLCGEGYFLSAEKTSCVVFPSGIPNCAVYSNATTCTSCLAGSYLSGNQCLTVKENKKVANCSFYKEDATCALCLSNFWLVGSSCEKVEAKLCKEVKSVKECLSCPSGSALEQQGDLLNCVTKTVADCSVFKQTSPYECTTCVAGFFLNSGACKKPAADIKDCLVYETEVLCAKCAVTHALAADKKSCIILTSYAGLYDSKCTQHSLGTSQFCTQCKGGYYFVEGECKACGGDGCYYCDFLDTQACLMCKTGYYMNEELKCIKSSTVTPTDNNNNSNNNGDNTDSEGVLSLIVMLMLALTLQQIIQ